MLESAGFSNKPCANNFERLEYAQGMMLASLDAQHSASEGGNKVSPTEIARRHEAADWALIVLALKGEQ